jgi:hypothetical protein
LPRRIHSVELLSRIADVTTDPIESGIHGVLHPRGGRVARWQVPCRATPPT